MLTDSTATSAVFADDLTGALEMGVLARRAGSPCRVRLSGILPHRELAVGNTLVLDTRSRELAPEAAAEALRFAASGFPEAPGTAVLKKTDSLLRGNIAAELATLRVLYPQRRLVYVPAYPLLGRTVRGGILTVSEPPGNLVSGKQMPLGDIPALLSPAFPRESLRLVASPADLATALEEDPAAVIVCDGQTQAEVEAMGDLLRRQPECCMVAGPAGVFRSYFREATSAPLFAPIPIRGGVGFIGSSHPASIAQWHALAAAHSARMSIATGTSFKTHSAEWQRARKAGKWLFLRALRAESSAPYIHFHPLPDALYLSGGATASACLRSLGCQELEPLQELEPGVVLSEARIEGRSVRVVTKSGAFGDAGTLVRILAILQGEHTHSDETFRPAAGC